MSLLLFFVLLILVRSIVNLLLLLRVLSLVSKSSSEVLESSDLLGFIIVTEAAIIIGTPLTKVNHVLGQDLLREILLMYFLVALI